jgi:hypothetical protein
MTFFIATHVPRKISLRPGSVIAAWLISSIVEYRAVVPNRVVIRLVRKKLKTFFQSWNRKCERFRIRAVSTSTFHER